MFYHFKPWSFLFWNRKNIQFPTWIHSICQVSSSKLEFTQLLFPFNENICRTDSGAMIKTGLIVFIARLKKKKRSWWESWGKLWRVDKSESDQWKKTTNRCLEISPVVSEGNKSCQLRPLKKKKTKQIRVWCFNVVKEIHICGPFVLFCCGSYRSNDRAHHIWDGGLLGSLLVSAGEGGSTKGSKSWHAKSWMM